MGKEVAIGTKYHRSMKHKTAGLAGVRNRGRGRIREDEDAEKAKDTPWIGQGLAHPARCLDVILRTKCNG